jgi:glutamine synthetase adenylyltransferase
MPERKPSDIEPFLLSLPDPQAARVFLERLESLHPFYAAKCKGDLVLLSRLLTVAAYSPFLAENLLQHPNDIDWFKLETERGIAQGKTTEQLSEDLSRLSTRMYDADARTLLVRFKNRELIRIYLRDCLHLATLAEVTEELSNLADVMLAYALKLALQEITNKHGSPLLRDERGRISQAEFAIVSLGKLGCRELNYASDIDLMFLYAGIGETAGDGRGNDSVISNKEFFTQVAQRVVKTISGLSIEGGAYRVDLRLRPYGRDGDLVWEIARAADYYHTKAENWERQMLIRARASAGNEAVFTGFFDLVRDVVFNQQPHPQALAAVRRAKEKIDRKIANQAGGFNVKLGLGGIREVEFIAQALQLAHGGREFWVRSAQTLIAIARLAEKGFLTEQERTALSSAYTFFRVVEHRLQMEHGAQTHTLPLTDEKLELLARRCGYQTVSDFTALKGESDSANRIVATFQRDVESHAASVRAIYRRVFSASESNAVESASKSFIRTDAAMEAAKKAFDKTLKPLAETDARLDAGDKVARAAEVFNAAETSTDAKAAPANLPNTAPQSAASSQGNFGQSVAPNLDDETARLIHQTAKAFQHLFTSRQHAKPAFDSPQQAAALSAIESIIAAALDEAINPVRSLKHSLAWAESFSTYNNADSQMLLRQIADNLPAFIARLIAIFSSQYLSSILIARPLLSSVLFETQRLATTDTFLEVMRENINKADNFSDKADALRRVWYELILGIGNRDLSEVRRQISEACNDQESDPFSNRLETKNELQKEPSSTDQQLPDDRQPFAAGRLRASNVEQTALAEASLQLATAITLEAMDVHEKLPFAILGLGRLGHAGMDYGSDLDLLVVFDDEASWPPASAQDEAMKGCSTAQEFYANFTAQLLKMLSSITREGFIYRVDLRLRPEGKNGALAQGRSSLLAYLNERASAWEHSAYLKVREVAGDLALGKRVREAICQTVFDAAARNASLKEELALMRKRLESEKAKGNNRDIKWGAGGMTDVYFITRYLQLRDRVAFPTEQGTAALVKHLGNSGLLDADSAKELFAGYTFLRRLDHWMRLLLDRPSQLLPASQVALGDIARSLGLSSIADFERCYAYHRSAIRAVYKRVFF